MPEHSATAMSAWQKTASPLIAARPGRVLKGIFTTLHTEAERAVTARTTAPSPVLLAFSGTLHDDVSGSGSKVGPERGLIDVVVTDRSMYILGITADIEATTVLHRIPLSQVVAVEGGLAKGSLFQKYFAIRVQTRADAAWQVLSPTSKEHGPALLAQLRTAVESAVESAGAPLGRPSSPLLTAVGF